MRKQPALLLLLVILLLPALAHTEDSMPRIRVLLKRLALTDRADIQVQGSYTLENGILSAGIQTNARLTFQVHDGHLIVYDGILQLDFGSQVKLIRHAETPDGSLIIGSSQALYPGDLTLRVSGGQIEAVLTINLEDYVLGVIPYEMSPEFPLEALKAQAVCARTYALRAVRSDRTWDVVDTTQDQVFRGLGAPDARVLSAVTQTEGLVGTYRGQLAECYYSASNGGQTETVEHVWPGAEATGLYQRMQDPYDVANPQSLVRKASLSRNGDGMRPELTALLCQYLQPAIRNLGFSAEPDNLQIRGIQGIQLQAPAVSGSLQYTECVLTLTWSGRASSQDAFTDVEDPAIVVVPVFPDLLQALDLSIAGLNNELLSVREEDDRYIVESRRYGHGVGMSQRGAEWMALNGWTFEQILSFYYPGLQLMQSSTLPPVMSTIRPELRDSPAPSASPTPRPTLMPVSNTHPDGSYLASVEGIEDDSTLNLRSEPTQSAPILMRLYKHQQLLVLDTTEDGIWVHVKTDSIEGYCMASFLERLAENE